MEFITEPLAAAVGIDVRQPAGRSQHGLARLHSKRSRAVCFKNGRFAFALLDRRQQIDFSWNVNQIPADPQWRGDSARRIKIQAERFGQLQQGDPITVPRRNQFAGFDCKVGPCAWRTLNRGTVPASKRFC